MTKKILLGLFSITVLTNCTLTKTKEKQLNLCDDFNIVINSPDTIGKGQELFASIHISNTKYKIIDATFACNVTDTSTVDTVVTNYSNGKIWGCNNSLIIERDTVKIWLTTGQKTGKTNFEEVTLLAKSSDNKYYYQKCTFDYFVK